MYHNNGKEGAGLPFVFLVCRFMSICAISAQKCTNSAINIDLFLIFLKTIRRDAYEFLRSSFCGEWIYILAYLN